MRLPPFKIERYFAEYEFTAPHLLCCSDCESLTIQDLLDLEPDAEAALKQLWLGYTESQGAMSLRREISRIYRTIAPEEVLVHAGAEEAIFVFMNAALGPGDHAVIHTPCYQSLAEVARATGCDVTPWIAREEEGWALDVDALRHALRPNTRVIVINTPHNPTGYLMPRDTYVEVNRIARERGIILFSDEVYRESEHDEADRLPSAVDLNETAVSLGVTSKSYGLPGLRIGWIATHDADLYSKMARLKDYTTICSSGPSEFLAELALRHREHVAGRNRRLIQANLEILDDFFNRHRETFSWVRPIAGPIAFPRYLRGDVDAFCQELVSSAGVLLLPGRVYDDDDDHFRIGFGRASMPEALARLEEFLTERRTPVVG